ncbi:hypothetical protein DQ04_01481070 [Trypanosoma grayi]|uniref:hypothetical protein n=1 Tax=Trypanosoma grayi TaxID=71804 RepID=UPI0004F465B4|nr:hypothetical protein DQ04_01481070 [Trypanosoma grayi]KEG12704.1 hypothetical protein DQ04_01481070 [Trypanosoma grayi]
MTRRCCRGFSIAATCCRGLWRGNSAAIAASVALQQRVQHAWLQDKIVHGHLAAPEINVELLRIDVLRVLGNVRHKYGA